MNEKTLGANALNILGEILWHSTTSDASIMQVSREHMEEVLSCARRYLPHAKAPRFLEVAAYAHITGYLLAQKHGWKATLTDISVETLALGARHAGQAGLDAGKVRRVAADFHDLPFPDGAFDIVYISSALHHTLQWETALGQLLRVTAGGGVLILQNEPCKREFCLYKFPTNRPGNFRPVEAELDRQGILKTVAEPYPGSRPESLFGMIENQTMPLSAMLEVMRAHGAIEKLSIDSRICMSPLDHTLLDIRRNEGGIAAHIRHELAGRLASVRALMSDTDRALGIRLPEDDEVCLLASRVAQSITALPSPRSDAYETSLANIFGGAVTAVVRKTAASVDCADPDALRYYGGERKGVNICFPPQLSRILDLASDLAPDVQTASTGEIAAHFPADAWLQGSNADLRYLVLNRMEGPVLLRPLAGHGRFVVLLRAYGAPTCEAFRLQLLADGKEIAGVDVHQADSFLLRGELPGLDAAPALSVAVCGLDGASLRATPPVTVAAVRVVCIADA